jgi:exopolyphosphatase/pppGpp-phosphohydrolase
VPRRIGVIDIGSTAIKALVADAERAEDPGFAWGIFEPPWGWQTARLCRLAAARDEEADGAIGEAAMRAASALVCGLAKDLRARAGGEVAIVAVATGAVRDATNRDEVARAIEHASGVRVRVLDPHDEARLSLAASVRALPLRDARVLAIDAGGGSTEIAVARVDHRGAIVVESIESLPFGAARFERACRGVSLARAYDALRADAALAFPRRDVADSLVAVATGTALARVRARGARALHGRAFEVRALDRSVRELAASSESARARAAAAGVPWILAILEAFGCASVTFSAAGLRYGVWYALAHGDEVAGARA